jgi:erythromycin esterase
MAKVRLVKYLHEELGYDVMAFESSTYECERAERRVTSLSAIDLMRSCIFGVWHTSEVVPLFEYIKQTQSTTHPLILAGFDEQTSSASASGRPAFFRGLIAPIDTAYAARVYAMDSVFLAKYRAPGAIGAERDHLVAFYDSLTAFFRTNRRAIDAAHPDDANVAIVARQAAISMTVFTRQLAAGMTTEGTEVRDRGMADNLDFLLNELYPGKKVIAWAHNFHIQRRGAASAATATSTDTARKLGLRSMGVWVAERHRSELYTIGLFMYRGAAAQNDRSPYAVASMRTGGLESILHRAPARYSFVDFSQAPRGPGTEWMWTRITGMDWGTQPLAMVPRDEYDGVLFIDTTHPPHYLPFSSVQIP